MILFGLISSLSELSLLGSKYCFMTNSELQDYIRDTLDLYSETVKTRINKRVCIYFLTEFPSFNIY